LSGIKSTGNAIRMETAYSPELLAVFLSLRKRLHLSIGRLVRSQTTAEDLVQDTFLRLWERRSYLPPSSMLHGYIVRTGRNLAIDFKRRERIVPFIGGIETLEFLADTAPTPEHSAIATQRLKALSDAISVLPPRAREVFIMARIEGMTYVQIGQKLSISPKTVFSHMVVRAGTARKSPASRMIGLFCHCWFSTPVFDITVRSC
jgi:RNA polymerase sigma factor (sigma-70 family)